MITNSIYSREYKEDTSISPSIELQIRPYQNKSKEVLQNGLKMNLGRKPRTR